MKKRIITLIAIPIIAFACWVFILGIINPMLWTQGQRFSYVLIVAIMDGLILLDTLLYAEDD
jgi:hypothetical protein